MNEAGIPAAPVPPDSPGARLRAERERRGLTIQQVVEDLHVEARLVLAMEAGNTAAFDAPVYARGFLRKYAEYLGLPADDIIARLLPLAADPPTQVAAAAVSSVDRDRARLYRLVSLAGAALLIAGCLIWLYKRPFTPRHPAAPAVIAPTAPATPKERVEQESASPAQPTALAEAAPAETVPHAQAPRSGPGDELTLSFDEDCWVEVYGPDGQRLLYDLALKGETRTVPGPGPWRILFGNVNSAHVSIDGRPVTLKHLHRNGTTTHFQLAADGVIS
jgi:cytoskeleton protein RodZ